MVILYSWSGVRVSHGLGLGFSHIVELWFGVSRVLVYPWDNVTSCIVAECSIMVILY